MTPIKGLIPLFIVLFCANPAWSSTPASGNFTASQTCEAYVSKNKRTNPGHTKLQLDKVYSVIEVNKANNPSWFRLRVERANPAERWVSKDCGQVDYRLLGGGGSSGGGSGGNSCQTAGLQDSYVLALSWQPAFCETKRAKPECNVVDPQSYQAGNFTLHGLWPNKKSCKKNYGYCGKVKGKSNGFCSYPALTLIDTVRDSLEQVMPSAAHDSCLQRHEWFKHGTCQTQWNMSEYYQVSIDLSRQFNQSGVADFMTSMVGKIIKETDFIGQVDSAHGEDAHQRLEIKCKGGNLVDVYIRLPGTINKDDSLAELMQQGAGNFKSNCGGKFKVDPIGYQ